MEDQIADERLRDFEQKLESSLSTSTLAAYEQPYRQWALSHALRKGGTHKLALSKAQCNSIPSGLEFHNFHEMCTV